MGWSSRQSGHNGDACNVTLKAKLPILHALKHYSYLIIPLRNAYSVL